MLGGTVWCSYIDRNRILMWGMESNIKHSPFTIYPIECLAKYDCKFCLPQQDIVAITFCTFFCLWKFHHKWNEYQKWCFDLFEDNKNLWGRSYRNIKLGFVFLFLLLQWIKIIPLTSLWTIIYFISQNRNLKYVALNSEQMTVRHHN